MGLKVKGIKFNIMGINKKCREINQTKNSFLKWLKDRKATHIEVFEGHTKDDSNWDYYRHVSAFVKDTFYNVYFMSWNDKVTIDYSDEENRYNDISIECFNQLVLKN